MERDGVRAVCRGLRGATEEFPFGESTAVFKVCGKMFALVHVGDGQASLSLKCEPHYAAVLRHDYAAVTPGYHLDKRHWNTIVLDGSVASELLHDWIVDSYDLVVAGLTRAARATLS